MVRFSVIGCGCIGKEHIRNLLLAPRDLAELVAVVDPDVDMLAEAVELAPHVTTCNRLDELNLDSVDAAIVCVPNHLHATVCESLVGHVHVLCEKPLATTMEDCERIAKSRSDDKVFAVGLEYRHIPTMKRLVESLDSIGRLRMLTIREHRFPFLKKVGGWNRMGEKTGGTLVEKGCHFFDFFALCCQKKPHTVYARGGQAVNHLDTADVDDHALVVIDFGDVVCTLDLCMFAEASLNQLEVSAVGSLGKIEAFAPAHGIKTADGRPNFRIGTRKSRDWESCTDAPHESYTRGAVSEEVVPFDQALMEAGDHAGSTYYELIEFAKACQGQSHNLASAYDAALSVAIGIAAQTSLLTHAPVKVDDVLSDYFKDQQQLKYAQSTSSASSSSSGESEAED